MSKSEFEEQVASLYRESVALSDDGEFLDALSSRIDAQVTRRKWLLTGAGALGASISCYGLIRADLLSWLPPLTTGAIKVVNELSAAPQLFSAALIMGVLLLPVLLRKVVDP